MAAKQVLCWRRWGAANVLLPQVLCGSFFFPGLLPGTWFASVMAVCCTTNGQMQCDCSSGGRVYRPYLTHLSLQHWDMHNPQISYRNLDKPGWCSFRACALNKSYTPWQSDCTKRLIILCPKKLHVCSGVLTPDIQISFPCYRLLLKWARQTAIAPLGRFSVLPSNAKQLCLLSNLRMKPLISWGNQLIPSRVTQLKFLLQLLTQSSPCPI